MCGTGVCQAHGLGLASLSPASWGPWFPQTSTPERWGTLAPHKHPGDSQRSQHLIWGPPGQEEGTPAGGPETGQRDGRCCSDPGTRLA